MGKRKSCIQAYHTDTEGSVPDHHKKASIVINESNELVGFPVHIKAIFTLYCSLVSVQQHCVFKKHIPWGTCVAQSVKRLTLDFGSGHDLTVCEFEPCIGLCADSAEPGWDSLSPSLSGPPLLVLVFSLYLSLSPPKVSNLKKKKKFEIEVSTGSFFSVASLLELQIAVFSLCPHVASLCAHPPLVSVSPNLFFL